MRKLKAPFPYYGGKSKVAQLVWERLGDVNHYVEPFAGSLAVLLGRPTPPRVETVNDTDCYLTNFWRCVRDLPGTLAALANYPVSELDLHAAHRWLVGVTKAPPQPAGWTWGGNAWRAAHQHFQGAPNAQARTFREHLRNDPEYKDPLYAARWVWGICQWIGGGWCQTRDDGPVAEDGSTHDRRPMIGGFEGQAGQAGQGVHAGSGGVPVAARKPILSADGPRSPGKGIHALGPKTTYEIMPGSVDHGIHAAGGKALAEQVPALRGDAGAAGQGIHKTGREATSEQRPAVDRGGGAGVHAAGESGHIPIAERRPILWPGVGPLAMGQGVHQLGDGESAGLPANRERIPDAQQCRTGGRGVHGVGEDDRALSEGRPQLADAYDVGRGVHSGGDVGTLAARLAFLERWFLLLADRLRLVRVCCGDWKRVCSSESVTTRLGTCGVFLDPPYGTVAGRDNRLYGTDSLTVAAEVLDWCKANGGHPDMRVALCGYEEEHKELSDGHGWEMVSWESKGYGSRTAKGKANQKKERIWFSPHCLRPSGPLQGDLFG